MRSMTAGFAVAAPLKYRAWQGVLADVWEVEASRGAAGQYVSSHPRLFVVLEETARGSIHIEADRAEPLAYGASGALSFIPAGVATRSHVTQGGRLKHLDLHFDVPALLQRFAGEVDADRLAAPRLMFEDGRIAAIARLLADECAQPSLHDLYGDSLALALFIELFRLPAVPARRNGQLSARRLRLATDFIASNSTRTIRLEELAGLVGLSQSYFCSAFKASTGIAPHQWQMKARIDAVKTQLAQPDASLAGVAQATGFADQAHMTRVFKQIVGVTPAAWLKTNQGELVTKP